MCNSDDMNIFCKKKRISLKKLIHPPSLTQLTASPSSAIVNWHRRRPRQKRTPYSPFCILLMNISHTSRLFDISKNFYMPFDSGWQPKKVFLLVVSFVSITIKHSGPFSKIFREPVKYFLADLVSKEGGGRGGGRGLKTIGCNESFIKIIAGIYAFRYQSCERINCVTGRTVTRTEHALNDYIY